MSYLPFALLAYLLNAVAVLIDKFFLTKQIPNPLVYIFYISLFSIIALVLIPFTHFPSLLVLILASLSTLLWTSGAYFLYKALQVGQPSRVVPVIGTLIPLVLLIYSLITETVNLEQAVAVIILILGLIIITLPAWKGHIQKKEILFEFASALLFASSYLFLRQAYLREDFLTVLAYSRVILIPLALILLAFSASRKQILAKSNAHPLFKIGSLTGAIFIFGQAAGGISELLLTFSISLASPALVNSLQGTQYIFLFLASLFLAKKYPQIFAEIKSKFSLIFKIGGIFLIGIGLYLLAFNK